MNLVEIGEGALQDDPSASAILRLARRSHRAEPSDAAAAGRWCDVIGGDHGPMRERLN